MLRRVLSVLRRQPALGRSVLAGTAALGLALACLNPQNDDLPSSTFGGADVSDQGNPANGPGEGASPPADNAPTTPGIAPSPQAPDQTDTPSPPREEAAPPGGNDVEPDAGATPDAAVAPNVAP